MRVPKAAGRPPRFMAVDKPILRPSGLADGSLSRYGWYITADNVEVPSVEGKAVSQTVPILALVGEQVSPGYKT